MTASLVMAIFSTLGAVCLIILECMATLNASAQSRDDRNIFDLWVSACLGRFLAEIIITIGTRSFGSIPVLVKSDSALPMAPTAALFLRSCVGQQARSLSLFFGRDHYYYRHERFWLDSRASQIGQCVVDGSPPLHCFFEAVLPRR